MGQESLRTVGTVDDPVVDALDGQQRELDDLITWLDRDDLLRPSRCPGWTVTDVLLHLAQTDEVAVASVRGDFDRVAGALVADPEGIADVDDWAAAAVAGEADWDPEAVRERWRRAAAAQVAAFRDCEPGARVPWVAGDLAARTLATTRLAETWVHTGDVAEALGVVLEPTDRLWHVARLAWRTVPYAFARAGRGDPGPVVFELVAPDGSQWDFGPGAPGEGAVDEGDEAADGTTVVRGTAAALCEVAGQRASAGDVGLTATGPAAADVLALVRTFA